MLKDQDNRVFPRLVALSACLCEKLAAFGFDPCFCGPVAGEMADLTPIGDDGDMGWVRLVGITPAQDEIAGQKCAVRMVAAFEVGFATCYPIEEEALTMDQQLEVTNLQLAGMQAGLQAILCCDWTPAGRNMVLSEYIPLGPEGGVVGGVWSVSVEV